MELKQYLAILWRRKWVILITTIVTAVITTAGIFLLPPTYEASTTLRVAPSGGLSVDYTAMMYATQLKNTLLRLATSERVLDELAERLNLDQPPKVEAVLLGNSELMLLTVQHQDPWLAREGANTLAQILLELNKTLYVEVQASVLEILDEQVATASDELDQAWNDYQEVIAESPDDPITVQTAARAWELKEQEYNALLDQQKETKVQEVLRANAISVFDPADLPEEPAGLPKFLYSALGIIVGLTAGVGLAFLFENLDTTLHTPEQIEAATQTSTLGQIPTVRRQRPMVFTNGLSPEVETYRRLRTNLLALDTSTPLQTMLVASAEPEEGKTTIVANLACAIAESGRQVVAVDCDLRRPSLHAIFGLTNKIGLSTVLQQETTLDEALQATEFHGLQVLCAGPVTPKPTALLDSRAMSALIATLRQHFDIVLFDTPAIGAVVDAAILAPSADGVLLVVERAKTQEKAVRAAYRQLADVGAKPIGVVMNRARQDGSYSYYTEYQRSPRAAKADKKDPLTKIKGIGPRHEKALRALGITTFARLGKQDAAQLAANLGGHVSAKRIRHERWIEQAQDLSRQEDHSQNEPP